MYMFYFMIKYRFFNLTSFYSSLIFIFLIIRTISSSSHRVRIIEVQLYMSFDNKQLLHSDLFYRVNLTVRLLFPGLISVDKDLLSPTPERCKFRRSKNGDTAKRPLSPVLLFFILCLFAKCQANSWPL